MFEESLRKTRQSFFGRIATIIGASELTEESWEDLESLLIQADMGIDTATVISKALRARVDREGLITRNELRMALKDELYSLLPASTQTGIQRGKNLLAVVLIVGVNGSGKTTTIVKLAASFKNEGWSVIIAAADTFRAAAIEQLQTWGQRIGVPVVTGQTGGDPGAVTYDAIRAARARGHDLLLIDTAGRLHNKFNLMEELKKIYKVAAKNVHDAPHEVWLVLDGTTGQNALVQAQAFKEIAEVTGVIITKLDSSSRGGMIFAIGHELGLPIRYIGVGEDIKDLVPFNGQAFVDALFD